MKKRLLPRVAAAVLSTAAIFFFSCQFESSEDNHRKWHSDPSPSTSDITLFVGINGKTVPLSEFSQTGIPYTATSHDVNPSENLTLTAECKDSSIDNKTVTGKITEPAENPPLTLTKVPDSNRFEVKFTPVTEATTVKIAFKSENEKAEKTVAFKLLPEPTILSISHTPSVLEFGKNIFYTLKPKITCEPDSFGKIPAENFILPTHKTFSYASSNTSAVSVLSTGELHAQNIGESDITISAGSTSCTVKVSVVDKVAPYSLQFESYFESDIAVNLKEYEMKTLTVKTYTTGADITLTDWTNSKPSVGKIEALDASLGMYKITALSEGETEFTAAAKYNPGAALKIKLTVSWRTVESVSVEPASVYLINGGTKELKAEVKPSYGAPKDVTWKSSNAEIATVDENGVITAHKNGTTSITVRSAADSLKSATCSVTVSDAPTSVTLNKTALELKKWDSETLTALVVPSTATQAVEWSADNSSLVSVYSDGDVHARGTSGKAVVTAASKLDPAKKAECTVYVVKEKVSALSLSTEAITMNTDDTEHVTLTVSPSDAALDSEYEIEGDNLEITTFTQNTYSNTYSCTVKSGSRAETKKITFKSKANPDKKVILTVTTTVPPVASVTINERNKTILVGQTGEKLTAKVLPSGAVQTVKWKSDTPSVAAVDEHTGVLTPVAKGSAVITAESTADVSKKDSVTVTVSEGLTAITALTADKNFVYYGGGVNLSASLSPADAYGELEWSYNNSSCTLTKDPSDEKKAALTVLKQGAKEGKVKVTVTSRIKPELKKELTVDIRTVIPQSISIATSDPADKMYKSEELQLTATAVSKYGAAGPAALADVKWKIKTKPYWSSNFKISDSRKLECSNPRGVQNGETTTVIATSTLDGSVKAEKEITVYDDIARLDSIRCQTQSGFLLQEWTLGDSDYPRVTGTISAYSPYQHFIITEKSDGMPVSEWFEKAEYEDTDFTYNGISIKPKKHTSGAAKTFYVFPVDPKTGSAATSEGKSFTLTVWEKPTGIEVIKGNFEIDATSNGGYESGTLSYKTSGFNFYARITPEFAEQKLLDYKVERVSGNYTCIVNAKKADTQDKTGWTKYQFDTNSQNTFGDKDVADFNFSIKGTIPVIKNYLRITSN